MNYESDIEERLLVALQRLYRIENGDVVFQYFYLRFLIEHDDRKMQKWEISRKMIDFLIEELRIPVDKGSFQYLGIQVVLGYASENSLENILSNWRFRAGLYDIHHSTGVRSSFDALIEQESKKLIRHGKIKAKSYKQTPQYQACWKYHALKLLNEQYRAHPGHPSLIEGISYPSEDVLFFRTLEERYSAQIHSVEFQTRTTLTICENDLENYMIHHLDLLEEGLTYIDRQVTLQDGRIDILAKDRTGQFVILELKVQEDKELIWQALFYPMQFKQERGVSRVRMITFAHEYPIHILTPLSQLHGVEIVQYDPYVELGKIQTLDIVRLNPGTQSLASV